MKSFDFEKRTKGEKNYFTVQNIRNTLNGKILTLRKKKRKMKQDLTKKLNSLDELQYHINLNLLQTNNDFIRYFFIDIDNPHYTMKNLILLLLSKIDDEVKYGIYAVRTYFTNLVNEKFSKNKIINMNEQIHNNNNDGLGANNINQKNKNDEMLELFLTKDIIHLLFEIIKVSMNNYYEKRAQINIYECLWILINMSAIYSINEILKSNFYYYFLKNNNYLLFLQIIESMISPQEIVLNDLTLLSNIIKESSTIKVLLKKSSLPNILYNYLSQRQNDHNITVKIIKLLNALFIDDDDGINNFNMQVYINLYSIFSYSLKFLNDNDLECYCLDILEMLSNVDNTKVIECFDDLDLLKVLNNLILNKPIQENEQIINKVLNIFYNLISKKNERIYENITKTGKFTKFYNNLLIKYKEENTTINYKIEENILLSLNNIIYFNHEYNVKYIFTEGREIYNFFLSSMDSCFQKIAYLSIQSFVNIFQDLENNVNNKILCEIAVSVMNALNKDILKCYYIGVQTLYLLMKKSISQDFSNEFRCLFNKLGVENVISKIQLKFINDTSKTEIKEEDEILITKFIEEIQAFLRQT